MLTTHTLLAAARALLSQGCRSFSACAICALLFSCPAQAYLPGGHYYVLNAMEWTVPPDQRDPYWFLIAYCAELPDLSEELDAVTQRVHVLTSSEEYGAWGWFGSCESNVSKHMAISQTYLHALNGAKVEKTRPAALQTLIDLARQYKGAAAADKPRLACATGFALHLYADAHAHAEMAGDGDGTTARDPQIVPAKCGQPRNPDTMYPTGLGHGRDASTPDYLRTQVHQCKDRPQDWIADINNTPVFDNKADGAAVLKTINETLGEYNDDDMEAAVDKALLNSMDKKFTANVVINVDHQGRVTRDSTGFTITSPCDDSLGWVISKYAGAIPSNAAHLSCKDVWTTYLMTAYSNFKQSRVGIADNPHIDLDCDVKSIQDIKNGKDDTLDMGIAK